MSIVTQQEKALKKTNLIQKGIDPEGQINGKASSTKDALYIPWKNGSLYENGYISKLSHSGELQWQKLIADVNQITTATDQNQNLYSAWCRIVTLPKRHAARSLPN